VLRPATRKAPQHLLRFGGPQAQGGGVLDELVVLLGDQIPADRPRQDRREPLVGGVLVDATQALAGDVLQPGQQPEPEQVRAATSEAEQLFNWE